MFQELYMHFSDLIPTSETLDNEYTKSQHQTPTSVAIGPKVIK